MSTETETLRRAAALMRERASDAYSAVDDGDWRFENLGWNDVRGTTYTVENDTMAVCDAVLEEPAVHIASWHPRVAFAVAEWLDREAALHDAIGAVGDLMNAAAKGLGTSEVRIQFSEHDEMAASTMPQALAVARAYLGETA